MPTGSQRISPTVHADVNAGTKPIEVMVVELKKNKGNKLIAGYSLRAFALRLT